MSRRVINSKGMPIMRKPRLTLALLAAAALAGCAAGPDYQRPALALPNAYVPAAAAPSASDQRYVAQDIPAQWWQLFHSDQLNALINASLAQNPTLAAAQAALRGAQENLYAQQGTRWPTVDASLASTRQKTAGVLASPLASNDYYYNLHTTQLTVSYTPDLFGANRRQIESLQAQAESQRFQLEASYLTLTSNVANAAIQEAALRGQLEASRAIVASQRLLLDSGRKLLALGQSSEADVAQQEAALAAAEAALPPLEKQLSAQRNALAALAGRYAADGVDASFTLDALQLPAELPRTLPSTLVEHRPDVRAAEALLHAASADVGVAAANRLPNVTLGVNAWGSSASSLGDLLKAGSGFWTLAGSITQPVFDGGALKHKQAAAQAAYEQAAAQYRAAVINAFQNVADALQAIDANAAALRAAQRAEQAAARSLAMARRQQELGDISTVALLASEQAWQQAKFASVQAQANRLSDTVALFQALGGGWWNRPDTASR